MVSKFHIMEPPTTYLKSVRGRKYKEHPDQFSIYEF
jgi:hypothetical protein